MHCPRCICKLIYKIDTNPYLQRCMVEFYLHYSDVTWESRYHIKPSPCPLWKKSTDGSPSKSSAENLSVSWRHMIFPPMNNSAICWHHISNNIGLHIHFELVTNSVNWRNKSITMALNAWYGWRRTSLMPTVNLLLGHLGTLLQRLSKPPSELGHGYVIAYMWMRVGRNYFNCGLVK